MILNRLYELASDRNLLDDPAFVNTPVACRVDIDSQGKFLGLHDLRERKELPPKGKKGKPKVVLSGGKTLPVPVRPVVWDEKRGNWKTTDPAAAGKEKPAVFLADTIARVLPVERLIEESSREKFQSQRATFWKFVRHAGDQTGSAPLQAMARFSSRAVESAELQEEIATQVEQLGLSLADLCTFALNDEQGRTVLEAADILSWWRVFFEKDFSSQQEGQFRGLCQVTGEIAAISPTVKSKINGLVPIGCRADAYLVTALTSAESYNLDGAVSGMVSVRGIDGFTRALNALIGNQLGQVSSYREAGVLFLFWTRRPAESGILTLFSAEGDQVEALLKSVRQGTAHQAIDDDNAFYLLTLAGNSARVMVRDYLESPLPRTRENLASWFEDLRIADISKEGVGKPTSALPLWQLSRATALDADQIAPDTPARLVAAALTGGPICESLLVACLRRLRAEGATGFRTARMGLIKLILLRREVPVSETLNSDELHPAYIYGRLLRVFEEIQYKAIPSVNATVVDKFYGTFSGAPALVFSRLYENARNHLRKIRGEDEAAYTALTRTLTDITKLLPPAPPRGHLSLQDQGRFALGYYHQRAKQFEQIADRKAKAAAGDKS
jgi:CRISPR-associated protein Csd1